MSTEISPQRVVRLKIPTLFAAIRRALVRLAEVERGMPDPRSGRH